jgi:hypothetical protein
MLTYLRVPGSGTERHGIVTDAETADSVVVALQGTHPLTTQHIPDLGTVSI